MKLGTSGRTHRVALVEHSPLRRVDPRTKLALSLCASLAVMLRVPTDEEIVEVLVEALRAAPALPVPEKVARCLVARGVRLEPTAPEQGSAAILGCGLSH